MTADRGRGSADPRPDLRREEITRIAAVLETTVLVSNADRVAAKLYDAGLRSQDTATARIAALEGALRRVLDAAEFQPPEGPHHTTAEVEQWWLKCDQVWMDAVRDARAVLSGETRTGGETP